MGPVGSQYSFVRKEIARPSRDTSAEAGKGGIVVGVQASSSCAKALSPTRARAPRGTRGAAPVCPCGVATAASRRRRRFRRTAPRRRARWRRLEVVDRVGLPAARLSHMSCRASPKGPIREWQMKTMTQSLPLIAPPTGIQLLLQGKGLPARFLGCRGHGGEHHQMGEGRLRRRLRRPSAVSSQGLSAGPSVPCSPPGEGAPRRGPALQAGAPRRVLDGNHFDALSRRRSVEDSRG